MVKDPVKPEYWLGFRNPEGYTEVVEARAKGRHKVVWVLGDFSRAWRCCSCGLMVRADELETLKPLARAKIFSSDSWQMSPEELQKVLWENKVRPKRNVYFTGPADGPSDIVPESRDFLQAWGHINWQNPRLLPSEVGES